LGESAGRYTPVHEWEKTGRSAGAAAAVAYTSLLIGEPVPEGVAVTGAVSLDGAIEKVAAVEEKLRAVFRERPGLSSVYVPAGQAPSDDRAREVGTLAEMIDLVFGREATSSLPAKAISVEATVRRGLHLYEKSNDFTAARYVLESALDAIRGHRGEDVAPDRYRLEEFLCLWRLASCLVQLGDTEAAGGLYEEARPLGATLWREQILDPRHHLGFMGNLAVYLRDVYRFEDAERLLVDTIQSQRMLRQSKRELARTLGNLGELRTMMGSWLKRSVGIDDRKRANEGVGVVGDEVRAEPDFACNRADVMAQAEDKFRQAAADLQEALEMIEAVYADEVPREYCYLGNLALARDEPERALELHRKGLSANETVEIGRERNEWFLGYGIVRALIASERYTAAVEEAHDVAVRIPAHEPYPRQLILRYAGQGLLACGKTERGKDVLLKAADLTFAQGALVRFGLSCALGDLAIHLLSEGDESARKEAVEHAAAFAARAEAVPGLDVAKGLSARVDELARGGAEGFARLSSELCRAVGWFLY
jgi:tetratricopeptide (TPR) repeat protein